MVTFKQDLLTRIGSAERVVVELGCGPNKRHADAIGIDALDYPGVDVVGDVYDALAQFPDGSVDAVYSYHFVEHLPDVERLIFELERVVRVGGVVVIVAPHFSNPYFYSDPTHRHFFGLYTFSYFASGSPLRRKVPTYQRGHAFRLDDVVLGFKGGRPFVVRHVFKRLIGGIFNSCGYMRELYEENFCYLFPCYEVRYTLVRTAPDQ